jgi:hypothetical protein
VAATIVNWPDFRTAPIPATTNQRRVLALLTIVVSVSRIWGRALSPWDWDEMLFTMALDDFDVPNHHPHPPGFPLFIATAKLVRALGVSHFCSLQTLALISGLLLVPAMYFFCRELRMTADVSIAATAFFAFLPNVWFFGETAFSDVPSIVLVVIACALLLGGCRSSGSFIAGAILLGVAAGYRPQNLTIGFVPAVIATWYHVRARRIALVVAAVVGGLAVVVAAYGFAAWASGGWKPFREAVAAHQVYISSVDSFRNPNRPPLRALVDDFFVRPFRGPVVNIPLTLFAVISFGAAFVKRRWPVLIAIGAFGPFAIAAWLVLDHMSASRFSIGYMPLLAVLAADGVSVSSSLAGRAQRTAAYAMSLAVVMAMIFWVMPAINVPRSHTSPPMQAVRWVEGNVPSGAVLYVDGGMGPFAEFYLRHFVRRSITDGIPLARMGAQGGWFLAEGVNHRAGARNFAWERDRLWNVARHRYFETFVAPVTDEARFGEGWYGEEREGNAAVRWMGQRASILLPAAPPQAGLRLRLFVPLHVLSSRPHVEIALNNQLLERFEIAEPYTDKSFDVRPHTTLSNELQIATDVVVNPARRGIGADQRDLGLRLDNLEWLALRR